MPCCAARCLCRREPGLLGRTAPYESRCGGGTNPKWLTHPDTPVSPADFSRLHHQICCGEELLCFALCLFLCLAICHRDKSKPRSALLSNNITRLPGCIYSWLLFFFSKHLHPMCWCPSCLGAGRRSYTLNQWDEPINLWSNDWKIPLHFWNFKSDAFVLKVKSFSRHFSMNSKSAQVLLAFVASVFLLQW